MDSVQTWVIVGVLAMAAITLLVLIWTFFFSGSVKRPVEKHVEVHVESADLLSKADIASLSRDAKEGLSEAVQLSSESLQEKLTEAIAQLSKKTEEMANLTLSQEFEQYQVSLAALRDETIKDFSELQKQLDDRRNQLLLELESHVAADREKRMDQFNARLGDVVSSYLVETLDKGVDLGAQSAYIVRTLESHKEDIKKDVLT